MKIAYLDCASGISGDMTLGALVDAGVDLAALNQGIQSLGLPNVRLAASTVKKKGFRATQITVEHEPEHKHRHLHHITAMIDASSITPARSWSSSGPRASSRTTRRPAPSSCRPT